MANSKFFLGDFNIKSLKLGNSDVKVCLGDTLLYPLSKPIDDAVVTCASATYNGSNQVAQDITVTLSGVTLVENTDYTVTQNTGGTNAGTYHVVVTGMGNYEGTASGTFTIDKVTPTVTAPTVVTGLVYNGNAQALINGGSTNFGTLKYSLDDSTYTTDIPSEMNATSYTIYYRVDGDSNVNDVAASSIANSIAKVTPTVVSPVPNVLTYNGSAQELVTAGSTNFGTLKYKVGSDSWSTSIPTRTRGGAYTVYFKVDGDSNVISVAEDTVACSINEKPVTAVVTLSPASYTYSGSYCEPSVTVKDGETIIDPSEYTVTYSNNLNAGTATVTIYDVVGGDYYVTGSTTFTINKAACCSTAPTAKSLTYNGSAQALLNAGSSSCGTMKYSIHGNPPANVVYYEYIENTSTSYIDTEYTIGPSNLKNIKLYIDFVATANQVGNRWWAHGLGGSSSLTVYAGIGNGASGDSIRFTYGNGTYDIATSVYGNIGTRYKYLLDLKNKTYNVINESGAVLVDLTNITVNTPSSSYSPYIFAWRYGNNGSVGYTHSNKVYSYRLYDNDVLVRDLVPCTYNGTAGMWDKVGNKFYGNKGGGSFTLGNLDWATTIPNGICATTYTTYWKVDNDANHSGTCSGSVSTTIAKADQSAPGVTGATTTYPTTATATASGGGGQGSIEWESAQSQTSPGSHTTRARWSGNSNYNASPWSSSVTVQMNKAAGSVTTAPVNNNYTYNGTARAVASAGSGTGTMYYRLGTSGSFSTTMPTMTNASSSTLYYYAAASTNYEQSSTGSITVSVQKASQSAPTATGSSVLEGSTATATASGGGGQGSIEWSNGNTRTSAGTQTTQARWGGNSNYSASPWSNSVTLEVKPAHNGHEYVEIGGVKWATMNIGASSVTDGGQYFQWGDTTGYLNAGRIGETYAKLFKNADYKFRNGLDTSNATALTKYNASDSKTALDLCDDSARLNWGGNWRMPTVDEFVALGNAVNTAWTSNYNSSGVSGLVCTDKTDSSKVLFFPAIQFLYGGGRQVNSGNYYWAKTLHEYITQAYTVFFGTNSVPSWNARCSRENGCPVRGVVGD